MIDLKCTAVIFFIICVYGLTGATAMTPVTPISQIKPGFDQITGLYGGIKNGRLLLILSDQGKYRYFALPPSMSLMKSGVPVALSQVPYKAPLIVRTQQGQVIEIAVQEVSQ
jgi:hypothetical protein